MLGGRSNPVGGGGPRPPRLPPPGSVAGRQRLAAAAGRPAVPTKKPLGRLTQAIAARPARPSQPAGPPPGRQRQLAAAAARPAQPAGPPPSSPGSPSASSRDAPSLSPEDVYIGIVKTQSKRDPSKYFIECRELRRHFESDVKMEASEKPHDVRLGDLVVFMLGKTHGMTPVAHGVKRVDYEVGNTETRWEAQPENVMVEAHVAVPGPKVYRGLVRNQSKRDSTKYFIDCPELSGQYTSDVKLLDMEKPDNVDVGDTIEFIIMEVEVGAPLAVNVTRVPVARQHTPGNFSPAAASAMASAPRVIGAPVAPPAKRPRLDVHAFRPAVRAS